MNLAQETAVLAFIDGVTAINARSPLYLARCNGDCLTGMVEDGDVLAIAPSEAIRPLDLVAVAFKDGHPSAIKILLGRREAPGGPVWAIGQFNPPMIRLARDGDLEALHRVLFPVGESGNPLPLKSPPATWAAQMISSLAAKLQSCDPINAEWRP